MVKTPVIYHLTSQCVLRAFLRGSDPDSGKDYNHRREWIKNRILSLSQYFAVEVYAYAIFHNLTGSRFDSNTLKDS